MYGSGIKLQSLSLPLNLTPVSLGGRLFLRDGEFRPYVNASIGILYLKISDMNGNLQGQSFTDNIERHINQGIIYNIGTGIIFQLYDNFGIDVNAQYEIDSIAFPAYAQYNYNSINFINVKVGLEVGF
jgi:hypothetical protein